jgi:hypothetical protein
VTGADGEEMPEAKAEHRISHTESGCNGVNMFRLRVDFRRRLVSNTFNAYLVKVDLACRTLFLARTAPSTSFLSQNRSEPLPRIWLGKQLFMTD